MRISDLPTLRTSVHCLHSLATLRWAQRMGYQLPHCGNYLCTTCPGKYKPIWTTRAKETIVHDTYGRQMAEQRKRMGVTDVQD